VVQQKQVILVIEDDLQVQSLEKRVLELEGYTVLTASSAEEALPMLAEHRVALVLLDLNLPGMNGLALTQNIRKFSQVPIMMVTAQGTEEEKVRALAAGVDQYLTKPFSVKDLAARVRALLRLARVGDG
jgi:DNA-binding response OmpR family regulator